MLAPTSDFSEERPGAEPESGAPSGTRVALRPMPTAVWLATMLYAAFYEIHAELATTLESQLSAAAITGAAVAALVTRTAGHALEAAFYYSVWRLLGLRVRFVWMFCWVISLSLFDALASATARIGAGGDMPWLAPIVGLRALPDLMHAWGGAGLALGGVGLLALARVFGTAYVQRREGAPWRGALALTAAAWIAGRLATWWGADLIRGWSVTR
jgi:hypothetical protein